MKKTVFILISLLWMHLALAQNAPYRGGNGDGYATNSLQTFNPQAYILKFAPYRGSNGNGYSSDSISNFNGRAYIGKFAPFAGGNNDGWANQPNLFIASISGYTACSDTTLTVNFQGTSLINNGNVYTVQISDGSGGFSNPTSIGSINSSAITGSINCTLPPNLAAGNYLLRVVSTSPIINGFSKSIVVSIKPNLGKDTTLFIVCSGETLDISNLYNTIGLTSSWNTTNILAAPIGTHRLSVTNGAGCRDTAFVTIQQDVLTWTGSLNNDWHVASNWSPNRVPNEKSHVIVNGSTTNTCTINIPQAKAASLQLKNGAALTVPVNNQLLLTGNCNPLPTGL
jgi:hypothetical protein